MTIHSPLCIRFRSVFMGTQWRPLTRRWERWRARAAATRPRRTRTPSPARDSATRVLWRRRHPRPTPSTAPRRRSFGSTPTHHCASTRHRDGLWAIPPPAILLLFPPPRLMANPALRTKESPKSEDLVAEFQVLVSSFDVSGSCVEWPTVEVLTSITRHWFGSRPRNLMAFRYGSGCGLGLSHSLPATTISKKSGIFSADMTCSAFNRGEFVTAARRSPRFFTYSINWRKPGMGWRSLDANLVTIYGVYSEGVY